MSGKRPHLLVAGASGKLGRRTAELLLDTGAATELILVTRTPAAVADLGERGCDVRFGDYSEPDSLPAAYAGAERMLLISASDIEVRAEQHRAAIARRRGGRRSARRLHLRSQPRAAEPGGDRAEPLRDRAGPRRERSRLDRAPRQPLLRVPGSGGSPGHRLGEADAQSRHRRDRVRLA